MLSSAKCARKMSGMRHLCGRELSPSGKFRGVVNTFNELATIDLARIDFESYDMVLVRDCQSMLSTLRLANSGCM